MKLHRCSIALVLLTVTLGSVNAAAQTPAPQLPLPPTQTLDPQDSAEHPAFWTKRHVTLVVGFGSAAAAGFMSVLRDRDVRARKEILQTLPPGSNDEWATQYDEAKRLVKDRNFWTSVAAGAGGVTLVYLFTSRSSSHDIRVLPGGAAYVWSF